MLERLTIGGSFAFQNLLGLTITTANSNSPWAYIREGLLPKGYLHLRFGGLISGKAYYYCYFSLGGGGGVMVIIGI